MSFAREFVHRAERFPGCSFSAFVWKVGTLICRKIRLTSLPRAEYQVKAPFVREGAFRTGGKAVGSTILSDVWLYLTEQPPQKHSLISYRRNYQFLKHYCASNLDDKCYRKRV